MAFRFKGMTQAAVNDYLKKLLRIAQFIDPVPLSVILEPDRKDEPYLNLAITAKATRLVTRDRDLLDLIDPRSVAGQVVRSKAPSLRILGPTDWLRELRDATPHSAAE